MSISSGVLVETGSVQPGRRKRVRDSYRLHPKSLQKPPRARIAAVLSGKSDHFGIAVSSLCAVHCTMGAALVGTAAAGGFLGDERMALVLAGVAILVAAGALGVGNPAQRPSPSPGFLRANSAGRGAPRFDASRAVLLPRFRVGQATSC